MPIQRFCELCGTEFSAFPSAIKAGFARFCSVSCGRKANAAAAGARLTAARAGQKPHNYVGLKIACANCGVKFAIAPCHLSGKYPTKYCSTACAHEGKRVSKPSGYRRTTHNGEQLADHVRLAYQLFGRDAVVGKDV